MNGKGFSNGNHFFAQGRGFIRHETWKTGLDIDTVVAGWRYITPLLAVAAVTREGEAITADIEFQP